MNNSTANTDSLENLNLVASLSSALAALYFVVVNFGF
jgi:hypothetical protein